MAPSVYKQPSKRSRTTRMEELVAEESGGGGGGGQSSGGGRAASRARGGGGGSANGNGSVARRDGARDVRPPSSDENAMPPPPPRRSAGGSSGGGGGGGKRGRASSAAAAAAAAAQASDDDGDDGEGEDRELSDSDRDYDARNASDIEDPPSDGGVEEERRERSRRRRSSSGGGGERGRGRGGRGGGGGGRGGGAGGAAAAAAAAAADLSAANASRALDAAALDADAVRAATRRLDAAEAQEEEADRRRLAAANGTRAANANAADDEEEEEDLDVDAAGRPFVVVGADGREWTRARGQGLPGQVKRVVLRDFMCHEHFAVDFCPHVNFVSGVNGSGKSALLQALQLALGVRASATGRASAAASLVRTGASQASVRVELWNTGPDAHRPELFGDTVVIERKLSAAAGAPSQFSLKTKAGRVVSTTKREVDAVLEALSVDAANPVVVMTQDVARSFLGGGGGGGAGNAAAPDRGVGTAAASSKKFEVYMKATLLSRAEASHAAAADAVAETRRHVEAEAERLKERALKVGALERALQRLEAAEALRGEVARCERAIAWAAAKGGEASVAAIDRRINVTGPAMLSEARERLAEAEEAADAAQRSLDEQGARSDVAVAELNEATVALRVASAEAANAARLRGAAERASEEAAEIEAAAEASHAAALEAAMAAASAAERARIERARAAAERARREELKLREAAATCAGAVKVAKGTLAASSNERDRVAMATQGAVEEAARLRGKADAAAAARASANPAAFFGGNKAVAIVNDLAKMMRRGAAQGGPAAAQQQQQQQQLGGPCEGPLGTLVGLSEPRWAAALQEAAGHLGATFFVAAGGGADAGAVAALFKKYGLLGARVAAVDPSTPPHHVKPLLDPRGGPLKTLLSVLDFSSAAGGAAAAASSSSAAAAAASFAATAARNYLIDACDVERIVLCESEAEAKSVARFPGVRAAVLPDGTSFTFKGGTLTGRPAAGGGAGGWRALYGGAATARSLAEDASRAERAAEEKKRELAGKQSELERAKAAYNAATASQRRAKERHDAAVAAHACAEAEVSNAAGGGGGGRPTSSSSSSPAAAAAAGLLPNARDDELHRARGDAADKRRALEEAKATAEAAAERLEDARALKERLCVAVANEQGKSLEALARAAEESGRRRGDAAAVVRRIEAQLESLAEARPRTAASAEAQRVDAAAVCSEEEGEEALAALEASGAFASIDRELLQAAGLLGAEGEGDSGNGGEGGGGKQGGGAEEEEEEESDGEDDSDDDDEAPERRRKRARRAAAAAAAAPPASNDNRKKKKKAASSNPAAKLVLVFAQRAELASKRRDKARGALREAEAAAGGGAGELRAELAAARPAYLECAAKLRTHGHTLKALESALRTRLADFKRMDRQVEESVNRRFVRFMKRKGHLGQVKVNREARTLDIKVVVHGTQQQQQQAQQQAQQHPAADAAAGGAAGGNARGRLNIFAAEEEGENAADHLQQQQQPAAATARTKVKDLRQLSGGERSFTTVCFALALGEFTSCPFRAMDEFDVFMDAVARRTSMASLFENAALAPHLQFVFLTPQDVRAVDEAMKQLRNKGLDLPEHYLKVLCMLPPKRGERR